MTVNSLYQKLGGLELPVTEDDIGESGLAALDPQRDILLDLFATAINSELGEAWTKLYAPYGQRKLGEYPVTDRLPDEPTENLLTQRKSRWPLLAVHRSGAGTYEELTLEITRLRQPWKVHYILGPLDVIDSRQLKDICVAVAKVIALVIRKRGHQAYQNGRLQFFGDNAPNEPSPFTGIRVVSHEGPGQAGFGGEDSKTIYWAIEINLETTEVSSYDPDAEGCNFDGATMHVGIGGGEGLLPDGIVAKTDSDPNG